MRNFFWPIVMTLTTLTVFQARGQGVLTLKEIFDFKSEQFMCDTADFQSIPEKHHRLALALFAKSDTKPEVKSLVNVANGKNCYDWIQFTPADGQEYVLEAVEFGDYYICQLGTLTRPDTWSISHKWMLSDPGRNVFIVFDHGYSRIILNDERLMPKKAVYFNHQELGKSEFTIKRGKVIEHFYLFQPGEAITESMTVDQLLQLFKVQPGNKFVEERTYDLKVTPYSMDHNNSLRQ